METTKDLTTPEVWAIESYAHTPSLEASEQTYSTLYGDGGGWDDQAVWVEPLAVAFPTVEASKVQVDSVSANQGAPEDIRGPQSEWVSEKMKEFGVVLGASYEGFEDRVLALLCAIEAKSGITKPGVVSGKKKSRVPRELQNLISKVNYDGGSTRTTSSSRRALMLSQ